MKQKNMKLGCIGLGAMGFNMALNFHRAGFLHCVWNRSRDKMETLARQADVNLAESPSALANQCDIIVLSVSHDAAVEEVIEVIGDGITTNSVIIDTSTIRVETTRKMAEKLSEYNAFFLDCPVSGGVEGARNGTLAMMVGGERSAFSRCLPALRSIATNIHHIGDSGSGQATKAVNQIMAAGINQAVSEALAFGKAMELNMDAVIDVISNGAAGNWFLQHRGKNMLNGHYPPGFKLALHHKDLVICKEMMRQLGENQLPLVEMSLIHYQRLMDEGFGDEDISALYRLKQRLFAN